MQLDALTMLTDTPEIHELYETFSGKLAFDVGASGGTVANIFAEHFEMVVACEPSPEPFGLMAANVADNVVALPVAVSATRGTVEFTLRQMSEGRGYFFTGESLPEWGREIGKATVDSVTLDGLADEYGSPDLVKVDTEGHEPWVVLGGPKTFRRGRVFVIEIHSQEGGAMIAALFSLWDVGYRIVRHEAHTPGSYHWLSHYWMVSDAA